MKVHSALILIPPIFFVLKILSAFCVNCIRHNIHMHFRLDFILEANNMKPDRSILFAIEGLVRTYVKGRENS